MNKRHSLFIIIGILLLSLAACGKEKEPPAKYVPPVNGGYYKEDDTKPKVTEPVETEPEKEKPQETEPTEETEPELSYIEKAQLEHEGNELYFRYNLLSKEQKMVYLIACEAIERGAGEAFFDENMNISVEDAKEAVSCVWNDHPEFFWYDGKYSIFYSGDKALSVKLEYSNLVYKLEENKARFYRIVDDLIDRGMAQTEFDRERLYHDYICQSTVYEENELDQSAYSCLVNHKTICAGYSRAFQVLMMKSNIPCYTVLGTMKGADGVQKHAWNIVKLVDAFYGIDLTSDDCDENRCVLYNAYNFAYKDFPDTYVVDDEYLMYPTCEESRYCFENLFDVDKNVASAQSFTNSQVVITSFEGYVEFHKQTMIDNGFGKYTFKYVIVGEDLMDKINSYINTGDYINTYVAEIAERNNIEECQLREDTTITVFENAYGVEHTITLSDTSSPIEANVVAKEVEVEFTE